MCTCQLIDILLNTHRFRTFFIDPSIWGQQGTRPCMSETLIKVIVVGSCDRTGLITLFRVERNNVKSDDRVHEEDYFIINFHGGEDEVSGMSLDHVGHFRY